MSRSVPKPAAVFCGLCCCWALWGAVVSNRDLGPGPSAPQEALTPQLQQARAAEQKQLRLDASDKTVLDDLAKAGASNARQRKELAALLHARGISKGSIDVLLRHTRDGIQLDESDHVRKSHLGGLGMLPDDQKWPQTPKGDPMSFIGALDLAELGAQSPLPTDGTLLVYADMGVNALDDPLGATRVLWVPAGQHMRQEYRREHDDLYQFDETFLVGTHRPIPGEQDAVHKELAGRADRDQLEMRMDGLSFAYNQLLGSDTPVQGPVLDGVAYELARSPAGSRSKFTPAESSKDGWMLLAQFGGSEDIGFGDGGGLYLVIRTDDLKAKRFDRVLGITDSH